MPMAAAEGTLAPQTETEVATATSSYAEQGHKLDGYKEQLHGTLVSPLVDAVVDSITGGELRKTIEDLTLETETLKAEVKELKAEMRETNKWHVLQLKYKQEHITALEELKKHSEMRLTQELNEKEEYIAELEEERKHLRSLGRLAAGVVTRRVKSLFEDWP